MFGRTGFRILRGMMLRYLAIWGVIILTVTAGFGIWQERGGSIAAMQDLGAAQTVQNGTITLTQKRDGHFYADLNINGNDIHFLVDTGATDLVLSKEDAARIGLDATQLNFNRKASTANGTVHSAVVRLEEIRFGPFLDQNISASVNGGKMRTSLLGMNYLRRFDSIQISNGEMILER